MAQQDFNGTLAIGSQELIYSYTAKVDSLEVWLHDFDNDQCAHAVYIGKPLEVITSLMFSEQARMEMLNA